MATITLDIKSELPKAIRWTDAMTKQQIGRAHV